MDIGDRPCGNNASSFLEDAWFMVQRLGHAKTVLPTPPCLLRVHVGLVEVCRVGWLLWHDYVKVMFIGHGGVLAVCPSCELKRHGSKSIASAREELQRVTSCRMPAEQRGLLERP